MKNSLLKSFVVGMMVASCASVAWAETEVKLTIQDHKFEPAELAIPARQKVKVIIENLDPSPEEFESYDLDREKIIPAHGKTFVLLGPLKPGRYNFFGDFNKETAQGVVVVSEV